MQNRIAFLCSDANPDRLFNPGCPSNTVKFLKTLSLCVLIIGTFLLVGWLASLSPISPNYNRTCTNDCIGYLSSIGFDGVALCALIAYAIYLTACYLLCIKSCFYGGCTKVTDDTNPLQLWRWLQADDDPPPHMGCRINNCRPHDDPEYKSIAISNHLLGALSPLLLCALLIVWLLSLIVGLIGIGVSYTFHLNQTCVHDWNAMAFWSYDHSFGCEITGLFFLLIFVVSMVALYGVIGCSKKCSQSVKSEEEQVLLERDHHCGPLLRHQ